jgi:hypothetical protein
MMEARFQSGARAVSRRGARSMTKRTNLHGVVVLVVLVTATVFGALAAPARAADSGDLLWGDILAASVSDDEWAEVGAAPDGGVYAVGTADVYGIPRAAMVLAKYDTDGTRDYAHVLYGGADRSGFGHDLAVDGEGAVIAVGVSEPPGSGGDFMVVKYDASGAFKWQTITSLTGGSDHADCVGVDGIGNVYVAGHDGWSRIALVKYDANGVEQWRRVLASDGDYAEAHDLAVDADGDVYVVGEAIRPDTTSDFVLATWRPNGRPGWSRIFGRGGDDVLRHVHLSGTSSVYVAGRFGASPSRDTGYVAKFTTGGTRKWQRTVAYGSDSTWINSMDVDGYGRLTACGGYEVASPVDYKAYVTRWWPDGTKRWTAVYYGVRSRRGATWAPLVCDSRGRVWCAGEIHKGSTDADWVVARYSAQGERTWLRSWAGADDVWDGTSAACLGGGGSFYVAGVTYPASTGGDLVIRKYVR